MAVRQRILAVLSSNLGLIPNNGSRSSLLHLTQCQIATASFFALTHHLLFQDANPSILRTKSFHFIVFQSLRAAIVSLPNLALSKLELSSLSPITPTHPES